MPPGRAVKPVSLVAPVLGSCKCEGLVLADYDVFSTPQKSIFTSERQVKYYFDKQMGSLPNKEKVSNYLSLERRIYNTYVWENLENVIELKDTTDNFTNNDRDKVKVKIWQNVKQKSC
jgi:hypothetical protein